MAVPHARQIRAQTARFDPEARDSSDPLAAIGLPILAAGGGAEALRKRREELRRSLAA